MRGSGEGVRAAVLAFAVAALVQPACAQAPRKHHAARHPAPLDIRPVLTDAKSKVVRARKAAPKPAETAKSADAPAGPTLASASSTPVILPAAPSNPGAAPMMPDLRPSLTVAQTLEQKAIARETLPAYMRVKLTAAEIASRAQLNASIAKHAEANGIPEALVHRVIMRESRYHPRVVSLGNYGLMQIRHATARVMGYTGSASGLLDAETNLTYAVKYLAGAYRKAHGNPDRAVALYARGY
jgi:soluble lytic murein transglycosylase-like protein